MKSPKKNFVKIIIFLLLFATLAFLVGVFVFQSPPPAVATFTSVPPTITGTSTPVSPTATSTPALIQEENATSDDLNVYYSYAYTGSYTWYRVYMDTDQDPATGFPQAGIGGDYLLEGPNLFSYSGVGGSWAWTLIKAVTFTDIDNVVSWTVARGDINEAASPNATDLAFQVESPLITSAAFTHNVDNGAIPSLVTHVPTAPPTATTNVSSTPTKVPTLAGPTATNTPLGPTPTPGPTGSTTVTYTSTTAIITNPERGVDHTNTDCQSNLYTIAQLRAYRDDEHISLVLCNFYLTSFKTRPIDSATLTTLQDQLNTIRAAGLKAVLRFAYTKTDNIDTSLAQILAHIDQLAPIIRSNSDVIALWQGSFIGQWGEGYYTSNFGDLGVISPQQWADRKAVVDAMLAALPGSRMVSLRTPLMMTTMYGSTTVSSSTAFNGSIVSRIGQHNDAFLAAPDDLGTYRNTATDYPWLQAQSTYTVMGGETANVNPPRSDCPTALQEMGMFHWSYINVDWFPAAISAWQSQDCWSTMQQKLGYRFVLTQGTYPNHASAGGPLNVQLSIRNDGFAAPFNPRNFELILRNNFTGLLYRFPLESDPRVWFAGTSVTIDHTITLPEDIPDGSYALLLNLPDPEKTLNERPEYSIRLANTNTWESGTGFNNLLHSVTIP